MRLHLIDCTKVSILEILSIHRQSKTVCGEDKFFNLSDVCINDKGKVNKNPQITYGYAPTIVAEFHGNLPKVIDVYFLKYQRTEYAKKIRKEYEAGNIKERRCNMREYTFRTDGCSNTITTVQKDNYIAEIVE